MKNDIGHVQEHLANERTFLGWLNTGVGIMAFGFLVVKFSFFVKQMAPQVDDHVKIVSHSYTAWIGNALVATGALATLFAWIRYRNVERQLRKGVYHHTSGLLTVMAAAVFLMSMVLIVYLSSASQ